jgi:hypothetical protein
MRFHLAALALLFLAVPAYAQEAKPQEEPETLSIYGRDFSVTPFQMAQPSLPWGDVKSCLPQELHDAPVKPI